VRRIACKFDQRFKRLCEIEDVAVFEEEGNCIVCLEMRADELMRRLISGELTNYSVVRTSPEPLQRKLVGSSEGGKRSATLPRFLPVSLL
jgi:hypothetical protein